MSVTGIYPATPSESARLHLGPANRPQLSDDEAALLARLPAAAQQSRKATHAELHAAIVSLAQSNGFTLELEVVGTGFMAVVARDLRIVANVRGGGEETFYCESQRGDLLRQLAEEIARCCGPQIVLPSNGDEGTLVIAS